MGCPLCARATVAAVSRPPVVANMLRREMRFMTLSPFS
jgi:hypothetical protein